MRYRKYFIAEFNEAAVLHLDFSGICISLLHTTNCNDAIWQTLIHFYDIGQVYKPALHAYQTWILDYKLSILLGW